MEDKNVKIKISQCQVCGGNVRIAVLHMMTDETKADFKNEAFENNLSIKEVPLKEYRETKYTHCLCADSLDKAPCTTI